MESTSSAQAGEDYERVRLPREVSEPKVRAAALELAHGLVLAEAIANRAEDFASPRYKPDAFEKRDAALELDRFRAWRARHPQLLEWARRVGVRVPSDREPGRW